MTTETFKIENSNKTVVAHAYTTKCYDSGICQILDAVEPFRMQGKNCTLKNMPDSDAKKLQNTIDAICDDCVEKQRAKMHELCR